MLNLNVEQTRRMRLKAQHMLAEEQATAKTPAQVLQAVCGVQAQDLAAAKLAIRARSTGLTEAQVEAARREEHNLAWTWCLRGTLHLVAAQDARWLVPFLGPASIAGDQRRLRQLGWDEVKIQTALDLLDQALSNPKGLTRSEIRQLLFENHLPYQGQATVHLIFQAALEGRLCAGADREGQTCYVRFSDWVGSLVPLPRQEGLARLAQRYLEAYAPAAPQDLASWSGLKIGEARQSFDLADQIAAGEEDGSRLVAIQAAGSPAWVLEKQLTWLDQPGEPEPSLRLLPRFDTYLLGYATRSLSLDPAYARRIHPGGGIIHPALLVDGQVRGAWKITQRGSKLEIQLQEFESLPDELTPWIEAEVADIGRFLGKEIIWTKEP
jgi:hypothetical protein